MNRLILALFLVLVVSFSIKAQIKGVPDVTVPTNEAVEGRRAGVLIPISLLGCSPGGELQNSYGIFAGIQIGVFYKAKSNFMIGTDFSFYTGNEVLINPLASLQLETDVMIGNDGASSLLTRSFRSLILPTLKIGYTISAPIGKKTDKSSGINLLAGLGWWGHRIRYMDASRNIPLIQNGTIKGYDRMTTGPCLSGSMTYMYLSTNRKINFQIGLEFTRGWLVNRRYNYDLGKKDDRTRLDNFLALKIGWILPIYGQRTNEYYYY
jgi:hypothetical protein